VEAVAHGQILLLAGNCKKAGVKKGRHHTQKLLLFQAFSCSGVFRGCRRFRAGAAATPPDPPLACDKTAAASGYRPAGARGWPSEWLTAAGLSPDGRYVSVAGSCSRLLPECESGRC